MTRRGATMIELLVVMILIGILANIALPKFWDVRRHADAAHVIADFNAIRLATFNYYAEQNRFPGTGPWGNPPPELIPLLPGGMAFAYKGVKYRWRRWSLPGGLPGQPSRTSLLGVQILAPDASTLRAIRSAYRGEQVFGHTITVTLVVE